MAKRSAISAVLLHHREHDIGARCAVLLSAAVSRRPRSYSVQSGGVQVLMVAPRKVCCQGAYYANMLVAAQIASRFPHSPRHYLLNPYLPCAVYPRPGLYNAGSLQYRSLHLGSTSTKGNASLKSLYVTCYWFPQQVPIFPHASWIRVTIRRYDGKTVRRETRDTLIVYYSHAPEGGGRKNSRKSCCRRSNNTQRAAIFLFEREKPVKISRTADRIRL